MKHFSPILLTLFLVQPIALEAQESSSITAFYDNRPAIAALEDLSSRYGVRFSYVHEKLADIRVTAEVRDRPLPDALRILFSGTPLDYRITEDLTVIVFLNPSKPVERSGRGFNVRGTVVDSAARAPLPHANCQLVGSGTGAVTDAVGRFLLHIPPGGYMLRVTVVGYGAWEQNLTVERDLELDTIVLAARPIPLDNVTITGERDSVALPDIALAVQPGVAVVERRRIVGAPGLLEPDLFRALLMLPGVTTPNDVSNELYVRGGTPDQNLVLLDGGVLYQPYHVLGIAGIVNPDIIDRAYVSMGGFSSKYGGRMSSVIDVRTRSMDRKRMHGEGTVSLLSSKLTLSGQPGKNWYVMAAGRRTYLDQASTLAYKLGLSPESLPYYFYDVYGKILWRPGTRHTLVVSGFLSRDDFSRQDVTREYSYDAVLNRREFLRYAFVGKDRVVWGNDLLTLSWEYRPNVNLVSKVTLFQSRADNSFESLDRWKYYEGAGDSIRALVDSLNRTERADRPVVDNRITDRTVRWDVEYDVNDGHQLLFGMEMNRIQLAYGWTYFGGAFSQEEEVPLFFDAAPDSFCYRRFIENWSVYVEDMWKVGERWTLKPGIRVERFGGQRPRWVYSPRWALRFDANERLVLRASGGLYYQSLFRSRERGYVGLLEIPFSTGSHPLQRSVHWLLGGEYRFRRNRSVEADVYYKSFQNLLRNDSSTWVEPVWIGGQGRAYGVELTWNESSPAVELEANYTLAWAQRRFEGQTYYTNFDQRHSLGVLATFRLPKQWTIGARFVLATGRAFYLNQFVGRDYSLGEDGFEYHANDTKKLRGHGIGYPSRLPAYHRLDLTVSRTYTFKHWTLRPYLNILNVYNRTNPLYYERTTDEYNGPPFRYFVRYKAYGVPMLPSLGAHFEF
jgi:hypothetical protein